MRRAEAGRDVAVFADPVFEVDDPRLRARPVRPARPGVRSARGAGARHRARPRLHQDGRWTSLGCGDASGS